MTNYRFGVIRDALEDDEMTGNAGAALALQYLAEIEQELEGRAQSRIERDLRIHLKDRDAHIRNLEAQLKPYLTRAEVDAEQGSML